MVPRQESRLLGVGLKNELFEQAISSQNYMIIKRILRCVSGSESISYKPKKVKHIDISAKFRVVGLCEHHKLFKSHSIPGALFQL